MANTALSNNVAMGYKAFKITIIVEMECNINLFIDSYLIYDHNNPCTLFGTVA